MKSYLYLVILFVLSCNNEPKLPKYSIVNDDTGVGYANIDIRTDKKLSKAEITAIATKLRDNEFDAMKVKLLFFLPDQEKGKNIPYGFVFYADDPDLIKTEKDKDNNNRPCEIHIYN